LSSERADARLFSMVAFGAERHIGSSTFHLRTRIYKQGLPAYSTCGSGKLEFIYSLFDTPVTASDGVFLP
jgi:hypothetical protein